MLGDDAVEKILEERRRGLQAEKDKLVEEKKKIRKPRRNASEEVWDAYKDELKSVREQINPLTKKLWRLKEAAGGDQARRRRYATRIRTEQEGTAVIAETIAAGGDDDALATVMEVNGAQISNDSNSIQLREIIELSAARFAQAAGPTVGTINNNNGPVNHFNAPTAIHEHHHHGASPDKETAAKIDRLGETIEDGMEDIKKGFRELGDGLIKLASEVKQNTEKYESSLRGFHSTIPKTKKRKVRFPYRGSTLRRLSYGDEECIPRHVRVPSAEDDPTALTAESNGTLASKLPIGVTPRSQARMDSLRARRIAENTEYTLLDPAPWDDGKKPAVNVGELVMVMKEGEYLGTIGTVNKVGPSWINVVKFNEEGLEDKSFRRTELERVAVKSD